MEVDITGKDTAGNNDKDNGNENENDRLRQTMIHKDQP